MKGATTDRLLSGAHSQWTIIWIGSQLEANTLNCFRNKNVRTYMQALFYNKCLALILDIPRNLSIVRDEDRLSCSADGYPTPTYKWTHGGTNTFTDGPVLKLDGLYEKEATFRCIASNALTSETKIITIQGWHILKCFFFYFTGLPR